MSLMRSWVTRCRTPGCGAPHMRWRAVCVRCLYRLPRDVARRNRVEELFELLGITDWSAWEPDHGWKER